MISKPRDSFKIWGKSVKGSWITFGHQTDRQTHKQTNRDYYYLCMTVSLLHKLVKCISIIFYYELVQGIKQRIILSILSNILILTTYRVIHQEWDCKDDPKWQFEAWFLVSAFNRVYWKLTKLLSTAIGQFWDTRNSEWKRTDSKNSVQSTLKSHPLWVTLYLTHLIVL